MHINKPAAYPVHDDDHGSREELLLEYERHENALHSAPALQNAVLFNLLPDQVRHLQWWLTKYFVDHVDIFQMYAEMGNNECTEMQLTFQNLRNPYVFLTTPNVGGTG